MINRIGALVSIVAIGACSHIQAQVWDPPVTEMQIATIEFRSDAKQWCTQHVNDSASHSSYAFTEPMLERSYIACAVIDPEKGNRVVINNPCNVKSWYAVALCEELEHLNGRRH